MNELIKIKTNEFDINQHREIIDEIERYAIASILCGKEIVCIITKPHTTSSVVIHYSVNKKNSEFELFIPQNKKYDLVINVNFADEYFFPSGFKGVFKQEQIKYTLKRYGKHFEYQFHIKPEEYVEKTKRLMKLFRRYL